MKPLPRYLFLRIFMSCCNKKNESTTGLDMTASLNLSGPKITVRI